MKQITSQQYRSIQIHAQGMIMALDTIEKNMTKLRQGLSDLGIKITMDEQDTESDYLFKVASYALDAAHEAEKNEEWEAMKNLRPSEPQPSWFARKLTQLAQAIG